MHSSKLLGLIAMILLLLLPMVTKGDTNDDPNDDILDRICEEVDCGKGRCLANTSLPLSFGCECESGWKRTQDEDADLYATSFLPCVIPECSLNYGCQQAPKPVREKGIPNNISAFDPCYWAYCGEGTCSRNRTHTLMYMCECKSDYYNLLDVSVFPCYSDCTLGSDCSSLGIKVSNSTVGFDSDASSTIFGGKFYWIIVLLMSTGMVMWS